MGTDAVLASNFRKFRLLLWKNWVLQMKHKCSLVVEVLVPVIVLLLFVLLRKISPPASRDRKIFNEQLPIDNFNLLRAHNPDLQYRLAYSPNTGTVFENIVKEAASSLGIEYSGFTNSRDMENAAVEQDLLAAVDFGDAMAGMTKYPQKLNYKIRFPAMLRTTDMSQWSTDYRFLPIDPMGPRNENDLDGGVPVGYLREGFLTVQNAISQAFITQAATNKEALPPVFLQRYPYPPYVQDDMLQSLRFLFPLVIAFSYIYPCQCRVEHITLEKEKQLKEVMKIMGLQNWLHWAAWFAKSFITMSISSILITVVLVAELTDNGAVLTYSSFMPILFFLLIYTISLITFCFMFSTFFAKASTASTLSGVTLFVTFLPFVNLMMSKADLGATAKIFLCLICNMAMGFGALLVVDLDMRGRGLHWNNMFKPLTVDDPVTMGHIILMMLVSSVIHMIICLYIEQIYPGDFGVPKQWNFPFTKSYWCGEKEVIDVEDGFDRINPDVFEEEPIGNVDLQMKNLTKKFGNRIAVNNVSINMYEDEITVLLGHNGAGKTTTIGMLTGMFSPTSGTATVNGYDVRTNIDEARMSMGFCPQHNVLFDDMTVRDHLIFYGRLKGLEGNKLKSEVNKYIKKIGLEKKANVESSKLSGGMKRKLSLCTAFCGSTKVVVCDEPSSGMDPLARRELWDLVQSEKTGRTVLLTTHFMDEADVLGDRIAILSGGVLQCVGSPFFLKKKFGSGYNLVCVKKSDCDSWAVTDLLSKYIPNIQPETEIGSELSYRLPEKYSSKFKAMFEDLEENAGTLKLEGFGVAVASLEEVFMKVGAEKAEERVTVQKQNTSGSDTDDEGSLDSGDIFLRSWRELKGTALLRSQWRSMILKKYLSTIRNKFVLLFQNICPIILLVYMLSTTVALFSAVQEPLVLDLLQLPSTVTVLETTSNVNAGSLEARISSNYRSVVNSFGPDHTLVETGSQNFIDYMLQLGETDQDLINTRYLAAATVDRGKIIAWLNNKPLHSAPVTLNLIHNAMARAVIGSGASISVTNYPLPLSAEIAIEMSKTGLDGGNMAAKSVSVCMCLITPLYVKFVIEERNTRAKLLQFVSGVRVTTFWLSHLVWDFFTYMITALIILTVVAIYQPEGFATFDEIAVIGSGASISVTNYPLPLSAEIAIEMSKTGLDGGNMAAKSVSVCMCLITPLYVKFVIEERNTRAKLLQFVSGVRVTTFWLSHLVWDFFTYMITALIILTVVAIYQPEGFATFDEIGRLTLIMILFGFSILPFTYLLAKRYSLPATGVARLIILNLFLGDILPAFVQLFQVLVSGIDRLHSLLLLIPIYALATGLRDLSLNYKTKQNCEKFKEIVPDDELRCKAIPDCCENIPYFAWKAPGVLAQLVFLFVSSIVYFFILLLLDYRIMDAFWNMFETRRKPPKDDYYDEDVEEERQIVQHMLPRQIAKQNLVIDRVTKYYGTFLAVNEISLIVSHSTCFGLLGINGAGKTTTFKMLTGDEKITSGEAYVKGISLKRDMSLVYQEIGYCPQFDALFDEFTGRETLRIYSLLRGIPENKIREISFDLAHNFGFVQHYDKQTHQYSGGNKRKLSTAIAVLGGPSVIYLDEPTSGMDPAARRQLWNMICKIRDAGKSIVLTSHCMDECEALCTRLAIMVNGQFKCIGSIQHLKNKFTKGLILKIKINKNKVGIESRMSRKKMKVLAEELMQKDIDKIKAFIEREFPQAYLQERFQSILTFHIPLIGVSWSKMFGLMEAYKDILNIEDYSISQTTLEEIFLQFAKHQREEVAQHE